MSLSYLETVVVVVVDALPEPVACLTVVDQVAVAADLASPGAVNQEMPCLLYPSPLPWAAAAVVVVVVVVVVTSAASTAVRVLPLSLRQIWSIGT